MLINPYRAGAGYMPGHLAGRDKVIEEGKINIDSIIQGYPRQPIIYYGLRGVGKTVLLNTMKRYADNKELLTTYIEVKENSSLIEEIIAFAKELILTLSTKEKIKKSLMLLKNMIDSFIFTYKNGDNTIEIKTKGIDGIVLFNDINKILLTLGELAQNLKTVIIFFIDEIQYAKKEELETIIAIQHRINQLNLPITIFGAGLPRVLVTMTESKTYAERLFEFYHIDSLEYDDCIDAILKPAKAFNITYTEEALKEIYNITGGYPYFIQLLCSVLTTKYKEINLNIVKEMKDIFFKKLDESFFRVRFDKCTNGEQKFMFAMSECKKLPCTVNNVAIILNKPLKNVSSIRTRLVNKGLIYPTRYGEIDFTVPQFKEFLQRIK